MGNRRGYTLVEVAVAMLLTAIMAGGIFSIALTAKRGGGKGLRKLIADQASRQLTERLKNFVTADKNSTLIVGPSGGVGGLDKWSLNDDTVTPNIVDDCGSCYALSPGVHNVTGILPQWFVDGYGAVLTYTVTDSHYLANGTTVPKVAVSVTWNEL